MSIPDTQNATQSVATTPLMKQYYEIKAQYPDAILLFRVGDFYETFAKDAIKTAHILGITLTKRGNGSAEEVALAGFPFHALEQYLPKLVRAGLRVAICEQLEDPKTAKGIVKRGVTELVTPGVSYSEKVLESRENNFLAALFFKKNVLGVSFLDASTGEFFLAEGSAGQIKNYLQRFQPKEILYAKSQLSLYQAFLQENYVASYLEDWVFQIEHGYESLCKHFAVHSLKGFAVEQNNVGISAAAAILQYLKDTQNNKMGHIAQVRILKDDAFLAVDHFTLQSLEILQSLNPKGKSLLDVLDCAVSPMGARKLRYYLAYPLRNLAKIQERQKLVAFFVERNDLRYSLRDILAQMGDVERLSVKIGLEKLNPLQVWALCDAAYKMQEITRLLDGQIDFALQDLPNLCALITKTLQKDAPAQIQKGGVIAFGVHEELDKLKELAFSGKDYLLKIQEKEAEQTGISSLKVSYNNVFGYYIEVRNTHKDKVPAHWIRKQTLTQAERYITEELKAYEEKILGAEEKILVLEQQLFLQLLKDLQQYVKPLQQNASLLAHLDVMLAFAHVSKQNNYVQPELGENYALNLKGARHAVIERFLPLGEHYVSNDLCLDIHAQQILMITGPNMSGKSAVLRQTALIVWLAQIGCFVPADSAQIGVMDKLFSRVGASDNLSAGESTFMVEMNEAASILNNLQGNCLVLMDEIGRGTSTYDGISIAWAIAQYLHAHPLRPKTLFATHYHELNEMEVFCERIKNYHISTEQLTDKILFLRKLVAGGSLHSFGLQVAKMAGMPLDLLQIAAEKLENLESLRSVEAHKQVLGQEKKTFVQYQLFDEFAVKNKAFEKILKNLKIDAITPIEAMITLQEIKNIWDKS